MTPLLTMGEALSRNAWLYPDKCGARSLARSMTFPEWNRRACRLANALSGLGLGKGDRIAILAYNCVEWLEIYAATAKAGLIAVPINFRLRAEEIRYIVEDCAARAVIVQHDLIGSIAGFHGETALSIRNFIHFGRDDAPAGFASYEALIAAADEGEPTVKVAAEDIWVLIYTSGTTGKPKGAMRSHGSHALLNFATLLDMGIGRDDRCLLVMPMCHANSLNFASAFAYAGATCCVYDAKAFEPEHALRTMAETRATFTSLVPTHYVMILSLPDGTRARYDVGSMTRMLISSAPARKETKLAIMDCFRNSQLFELYGSTEQGWATLLRPEEQLTKLGSVGREFTGSAPIKLIAENGDEAADGEVGELYSRTPWCFEGYWNLPEKTAEAFRGPYLSVGDVARRDADGFYTLVDRKSNMIISGGENVYPSEVENLLGGHPNVRDVAVIGRPDPKWGEAVHAVVVLRAGASASEAELVDWCANRIAGYKRPKSVSFVADEEMPRTATGKILHRVLKARYERDA